MKGLSPRVGAVLLSALIPMFCSIGSSIAQSLTLVDKGTSKYCVFHRVDAPSSVKTAAMELQRILKASTGVELPVTADPSPNMICLGDNAVARAAGFDPDSLPYEAFRIATRGRNLYIFGRDAPDGQKTPWNGFSRGTQFGVYEFLERVVGVRWLMPGEWGEEIPQHVTLTVPEVDVKQQPGFLFRVLGISDPPVVKEWLTRQRVSGDPSYWNTACTKVIYTQHSWGWYLPEDLKNAHPEWNAIKGEKNKFCTRNAEAVRALAEGVVNWFDKHPNPPGDRWMASISPSDGQSFCRCEQCSAHIEKDAHGVDSFTVNLLDFYNEVARVVAEKRPGKMVAGYAYGRCEYPPKNPMRLEQNVFIEWTPLNYYGMGLYKPGYRQEFEKVASAWAGMTKNLGYQNYCHWHRSEQGAPYAAALSLLKFQFPLLKKHGFQSVQEYGTSAWGYGGPNNYLLARLMWNPATDVDKTYREWLPLAYGPAWQAMDRVYRLLDERYQKFKVEKEPFPYTGDNYEIMSDKIESIYLPILPTIEKLYVEAYSGAETDRQRKRVQMFGDNMVIFHRNLRKADYLLHPEQSVFYRTDGDYEAFIKQDIPNVYGGNSGPGWLWVEPQIKGIQPPPQTEKRALVIPLLPKERHAPVIDGTLSPGEWNGAAVADSFRIAGSRAVAVRSTTARMLYNQNHLYLSFECDADDLKQTLPTRAKQDNAAIFDGEAVEVVFGLEGDPQNFWHIALNPANSRWDGIRANAIPNLDWTGATKQGARQWTAEIAIPFVSLGIDAPRGTRWRVNLCRSTPLNKDGERELSAWNNVPSGFLDPDYFGVWIFENQEAGGA